MSLNSLLPAIVIPAYNRPHTLTRLLTSLNKADYPSGAEIPLIISIDPENGSTNQLVLEAAESFHWQHGTKKILQHSDHLGLLGNFYYCGDLTEQYDAVIFLEDDIVVSPVFYWYATQSLRYFTDASPIAGISLYRYAFNGYTHFSFEPLSDGSDIFFMQLSSIMGQAWTRAQWLRFQEWRTSKAATSVKTNQALHEVWSIFDADDYFPVLTNYLVSTRQFYVFPRVSLTTGFGDAGTHFTNKTSYFQVPLQQGLTSFQLQNLEESNSVYDSFMEILPACLKKLSVSLRDIDFDVDLNATKKPQQLKAGYVLTTRASRQPMKTYALAMRPPEANLLYDIQGKGINLCRPAELLWNRWNDLQTHQKLHAYFTQARRFSRRQSVIHFMFDMASRFKI